MKVDRIGNGDSGPSVRPNNNEGHSHAVVIHVLFADQAMASHREAVVRGKNNPGIFGHVRCLQAIEDLADLLIKVGDAGKVFLAMHLDSEVGARKQCQFLVTQ